MLNLVYRNADSLELGQTRTLNQPSGGGTIAVTTNPAGGERAVACVYSIAIKTAQARRGYVLRTRTHAVNPATYEITHSSLGIHLVGACLDDGGNAWNDDDFVLVISPNNGAVRSGVGIEIARSSGDYYYRLVQDVSGTPTRTLANRALQEGTRHDMRMIFVRPSVATGDGLVVLQTRYSGDSDWVTEINQSISNESDNRIGMLNVNIGLIDASALTGTVTTKFSTEADRLTTDIASIDYLDDLAGLGAFWRECHAIEVSQNSATVRMNILDGEWADATHCRVMYAAGDSATGGTTTTARSITGDFDSFGNYFETLSGLTADQKYAACVQVGNSDFSSIYATSHTFFFRTVPAKGSASELFRVDVGCIDNHFSSILAALPDLRELVDEAVSIGTPQRIVAHGDMGYSDAGAYWDSSVPYEDEAGFNQMFQELYTCEEWTRLCAIGATMGYPDDHDVSVDDGDGRMRPGGSLYSTEPDDWDGLTPALEGEYTPGVTLGDITDAGLAVYESWWGGGWINRAVSTEFYGYRIAGREYEIIFDTRWQRDPDASAGIRMTGQTQRDWIQARIAEAAADNKIKDIRLLNGGPLWEIGERDDNTEGIDPDFAEWLIQELLDNVRSDQRVIMRASDAHMGACFHLHLPNGTGMGQLDDSDTRFVYEVITSGLSMNSWTPASGANSVFNTTAVANDTILWAMTPGNANVPSNGDWGVSSGLLTRRNYTTGTLDHWFQSGKGTSDALDWGDLLLTIGGETVGSVVPIILQQMTA